MIQFDEHIFQMGWNHQVDKDPTDAWPVFHGLRIFGRFFSLKLAVATSHLFRGLEILG